MENPAKELFEKLKEESKKITNMADRAAGYDMQISLSEFESAFESIEEIKTEIMSECFGIIDA